MILSDVSRHCPALLKSASLFVSCCAGSWKALFTKMSSFPLFERILNGPTASQKELSEVPRAARRRLAPARPRRGHTPAPHLASRKNRLLNPLQKRKIANSITNKGGNAGGEATLLYVTIV